MQCNHRDAYRVVITEPPTAATLFPTAATLAWSQGLLSSRAGGPIEWEDEIT